MTLKSEIVDLSGKLLHSSPELSLKDRVEIFNLLSVLAASIVEFKHPALNVQLVRTNTLEDNDYNPNVVSPPEYRLLTHSIREDGITMPLVVAKSQGQKPYVVVDGYHRAQIIKFDKEVNKSLADHIPVVILAKPLDKRISSSVRHNMARGSHQVKLTAKLILRLKELNWTNDEIGKELGMDSDEVLRMQQITGLAEAFKNDDFSTAWD
ncbi:MAG: ParB N-terminal domain-containing protein [Pseudomonadales bacterium]|jgi:ParB-like chromosome segregation protein Spo0J